MNVSFVQTRENEFGEDPIYSLEGRGVIDTIAAIEKMLETFGTVHRVIRVIPECCYFSKVPAFVFSRTSLLSK